MVRKTNNQISANSGLVSSRVEMYESTRRPTKPSYQRPEAYAKEQSIKSSWKNVDKFEHELREDCYKEDYECTDSTLVDIGVEHYAQGDYEKSLKAFKKALNTYKVSQGDSNHIDIAHTHANIAAVYLQQGKFCHAQKELDKVLNMKECLPCPPSSDDKGNLVFARALNNYGNLLSLNHDYDGSLAYYRQSLQDLRQIQGVEKDIADVLYNIGRVQVHKKEWDLATSNLIEACRITKATYGTNHLYLARTLSLIGFVQLSTTSYDDHEEHCLNRAKC